VILLVDARQGVREADQAILARLPPGPARITAHNKIDLAGRRPERREDAGCARILLSAGEGDGIDLLKQELLRSAGWRPTESVFIARERHLRALAETHGHLQAARAHLTRQELFAEELRMAQRSLSAITGEFSADDLLGEIFGRFCIGSDAAVWPSTGLSLGVERSVAHDCREALRNGCVPSCGTPVPWHEGERLLFPLRRCYIFAQTTRKTRRVSREHPRSLITTTTFR
ncbi:MAG: hypothetical protein LBO00_07810, partial [Zoogloeaceae bacterium]|jgi:hypothetical protein|nr:hypothetical protein [Zoogloeaceae bacterium]